MRTIEFQYIAYLASQPDSSIDKNLTNGETAYAIEAMLALACYQLLFAGLLLFTYTGYLYRRVYGEMKGKANIRFGM